MVYEPSNHEVLHHNREHDGGVCTLCGFPMPMNIVRRKGRKGPPMYSLDDEVLCERCFSASVRSDTGPEDEGSL